MPTAPDPVKKKPSSKSAAALPMAGVTEEDGRPVAPKRTVSSIADARAVYSRMRLAHGPRLKRFAKIQGMIDGNPPYNPAEMRKLGLPTSNVNWKDAEAIYESVAIVFWGLFNDVDNLAKFETDLSTPDVNKEIGGIVSEEWDRAIRSWRQFAPLMQQHQGDFIKFGSSLFYWPDERNWQFDVADIWKFLVPEETRNRTDAIPVCAIEVVMTPYELWDLHENYTGKVWNKDQIAKVLTQLSSTYDKTRDMATQWMAIQAAVRSQSQSIGDYLNTDIQLCCMLMKEFDGKFSKVIFHASSGDGFLFEAPSQYECAHEAMLFMSLVPGEKHIHGVRGLGHRIYNLVEALTKLDGHLFDTAKASSTVFLKTPQSARNKDGKRLKIDFGGIVDIGEADFGHSLIGSNIAPAIEVSQYFSGKLRDNCQIYTVAGSNMANQAKRSATEVAQIARREAKVQKSLIALYYQQLDLLFQEMVRKMLKSEKGDGGWDIVEQWKKRCVARGVPEEFFVLNDKNEGHDGLPIHLRVTATRAGGSGSQMADQIEMRDMLTLLPLLGERGREAVVEDAIAAYRGHSYVDRYRPKADVSKEPIAEDCLADGENNDMEQGFPRLVSPDNNHAVHCIRHMERMKGIAQQYIAKKYDLLDCDKAFEELGPHFARHLLYLSRDSSRKDLLGALGSQWRVIANFADMVKNNAQAKREADLKQQQKLAQEQAAAANANSPEMVKVLADNERKNLKLQADIERNAKRDQMKFLLDRMKITFEAQMNQQKAAHDMALEAIVAQSSSTADEVSGKPSSALF